MRRLMTVAGLLLAASLWTTLPAQAQGSAVYTHSACMTARAGAGVAAPCADGSAIWYNPAALATHPGVISAGVTWIRTDNAFTYDVTGERVERDAAITPVPHLYASYRLNPRLALGLGAWAPFGLGIEWPIEFEGRFVGYDNALQGIYIQPTVAYQVVPGRLSIGAGADIVLGSIEINRRLDLALQFAPPAVTGLPQPVRFAALGVPLGTDFADVQLEGDATAFTFHVGALANLTERLSIGARYMHSAELDFEGAATFTQVQTGLTLLGTPLDPALALQFSEQGTLADQSIAASLTLPAMAVVGVAFDATPSLTFLFDYQFTNWSTFDEAPIDFERAPDQELLLHYNDTHTFHFGAEIRASDALELRLGYRHNTAAEPDVSVTPLLPEGKRNYFAAGIGYEFTERFSVDAFYEYVRQPDRRGRVRPRRDALVPPEDLIVGVYSSSGHLFGATLSYQLGS